jgi:hypothetical protein
VYSAIQPTRGSSVVRFGARMLAAGLCLAAAVAISALITGRFGETSARVLLTGLAAILCTIGGLAGSATLALQNRARRVGGFTIGLSQLSLLLALVLIWVPSAGDGEAPWRALGVTSVLMLAGVHASLLLSRLDADDPRAVHWLSYAAIACASAAALVLGVVFAAIDGVVAADVWRLLGVLVVLAVLNTLLAPLARKVARESRPSGGNRDEPPARACA